MLSTTSGNLGRMTTDSPVQNVKSSKSVTTATTMFSGPRNSKTRGFVSGDLTTMERESKPVASELNREEDLESISTSPSRSGRERGDASHVFNSHTVSGYTSGGNAPTLKQSMEDSETIELIGTLAESEVNSPFPLF